MAEEQEAQTQDGQTDEHHAPGAYPVGQVALDRPHQAALDSGEGQGETQLRPGPSELPLQRHRPQAHGVKEGHGGNDHDETADGHQPPTVKNTLCRP